MKICLYNWWKSENLIVGLVVVVPATIVHVDCQPAWYTGNQGAIFIRVKGAEVKSRRWNKDRFDPCFN